MDVCRSQVLTAQRNVHYKQHTTDDLSSSSSENTTERYNLQKCTITFALSSLRQKRNKQQTIISRHVTNAKSSTSRTTQI